MNEAEKEEIKKVLDYFAKSLTVSIELSIRDSDYESAKSDLQDLVEVLGLSRKVKEILKEE